MEDKYQKYRNRAFTSEQWFLLRKAIDEGIDVKDIANERFSSDQMEMLLEARRNGIDLSAIADPELSEEQMRRLIRKISEEMGLYEAHYEKTRRKWLKNITWTAVLAVFLFVGSTIIFATKDSWMKYFQELYVKLSEDTITLEVGEKFDPAKYVTAFDPQAELLFPDDISTDKAGSIWAVYTITNGRKSKEVRLLVNVADTKPPDIVLTGAEITIEQGAAIDPLRYLVSAKDLADGDVADNVQMNVLDNSIQYIVSDSSGNEARKEIAVHFKQPPAPPVKTPVQDQPKESGQLSPPAVAPSPSPHVQTPPADRAFPFQDGRTANETYQECMTAASGTQGTFRASCQIYSDSSGIHRGYQLHFN